MFRQAQALFITPPVASPPVGADLLDRAVAMFPVRRSA
jgi:hypothetical protein